MASPHLYVRSTDGSDADNGTTWALAKASVAGAAAIDSTTDNRIWLSDNHAESNAAAQSWAFAGTLATPTWVVCVDDAGSPEPPTALATTATVTTTGANGITITGNVYVYGVTFNVGSGAVTADLILDNASTSTNTRQTYENCNFQLVATGATCNVEVGAAANAYPSLIVLRDVGIKFANASQRINVALGELVWEGGSIISGSTAITTGLIAPNSSGEFAKATISGVDLSNLGSASYLAVASANGTLDVVFRNCKLPASWTGGLVTGTLNARDRVEMYNCDNADTNYRLWIEDYTGAIKSNDSIYNDAGVDTTGITNGGSDISGFSWEMVTTANAEFPHMALRSPEIVKWNETTTGTLTATVEIVHNSQGSGTSGALRDDEIWLEVMCLDPGGTPVGKWESDRCANLNLNSDAADQASSSAAWTGDAAGWDTQKLVVSFTPKEKGYVHARVMLAKASATVYVDPLLTIA